ncbi:LolA-like outer membrane lipoprotein chaperone [Sulfurospirillum sp. 1307]|jgi:outer membrane lipoprotein carrier protein
MKFLISVLLLFASLYANPLDFNSIQSDFTQIITNEENSTITYEGSFYAKSNAKALWIYKSPISKKIYFNQNQVVIIEPELEQAIITNLKNTPNLTELLKDAKKVEKNLYETSYYETTYKIFIEDDHIKKISYEDKLANQVTIELKNQSVNIFLDDELFKAKIPNGFDIIAQ